MSVCFLGQGTAGLAKGKYPIAEEEKALRTGIELGMNLIDTAEIYGSEELVGTAIARFSRDKITLVSKVWPEHVAGDGIQKACEGSLRRLGTDYLDFYLLHWPTGITDFAPVVDGFEKLRHASKIRYWGVSNFSAQQMTDLLGVRNGILCVTNQVPYHLGNRGFERDLLPWCATMGMTAMAYSPLGGPGASTLRNERVIRIAQAHDCSPAAVALSWVMRSGRVIAIPEAGCEAHVKQNAEALSLALTPEEYDLLSAA